MPEFTDNNTQKRFEYIVDGQTAFANYRRQGESLYIDYVEAPQALRGTGAAGKLMEHVAQVAKQQNLKIVPICGYAASWLKRHPQDTQD